MPPRIATDCQHFKSESDGSLCSRWDLRHGDAWPILTYADEQGKVRRRRLECDPSCPQYAGPRSGEKFRARVYKLAWDDGALVESKNWRLCHRCASYGHIEAPDLIISPPKDCSCECHRKAVVFKRVKD